MNAKYIHIFGRFDRIREWKWVRERVSEWVRERERKAEAGRVSRHKWLAKSLPCTGKNRICVHKMRQKTMASKPEYACGRTCDYMSQTHNRWRSRLTRAGFACFHWYTWALANMSVALAKGISASTLPGLFTTFLVLASQSQHHYGAVSGRAKDILLDVLLRLHNTQHDSWFFACYDFFHGKRELQRAELFWPTERGRLPARGQAKRTPVLGFLFFVQTDSFGQTPKRAICFLCFLLFYYSQSYQEKPG